MQAIYLALLNNVDYETEFNCQDDLATFTEFIKSIGLVNKTVTINKKSIKSAWVPVSYFKPEIRKKFIKLVSKLLVNFQNRY